MTPRPDVAVHGAGLTGLTLGLSLARAGVTTTVVDPQLVPGRRDGLMAGTASVHQELQHHHVWRWYGEAAVRRYAEEAARGQALTLALAAEAGVRVQRRPLATVTSDGHEAFWLRHESQAERLVGLAPDFTDTTGLPLATRHQLFLDNQPVVDVVAHRDALIDLFREAGGTLATVSPETAGRRVYATPEPPPLPSAYARLRVDPATWTWLAFRAPHPVSRDTFDLDEGGRLIVAVTTASGDDELWVGSRGDDGAAWVARFYGDPTITARWQAPTSVTSDALPYVGRLPGSGPDRDLVACGFGPWELTLGSAAALQLTALVTGQSTDLPWAPARLPRPAALGRAVWGQARRALGITRVPPFPRRG